MKKLAVLLGLGLLGLAIVTFSAKANVQVADGGAPKPGCPVSICGNPGR